MSLDVAAIREQFPLLQRQINGQPLVYLDSANTSQKPRSVIDAMTRFMTRRAPVRPSIGGCRAIRPTRVGVRDGR